MISDVVRRMIELGAPSEAINIAVEAIESLLTTDRQRREKLATQKRKERARSRDRNATVAVKSCDEDPSPKEKSPTPPKEITPPRTSLRSDKDRARSNFLEFWSAFPVREGRNPKHPAETIFVRLVLEGEDPAAMIAGAKRYAAVMLRAEKRFVVQARKWLGERSWSDEDTPVRSPARASPGYKSSKPSHISVLQQDSGHGKASSRYPVFASSHIPPANSFSTDRSFQEPPSSERQSNADEERDAGRSDENWNEVEKG